MEKDLEFWKELNKKCDEKIITNEINRIRKEAQKELLRELFNSLEHDNDEDETLYLPLNKLGELKDRLNKQK